MSLSQEETLLHLSPVKSRIYGIKAVRIGDLKTAVLISLKDSSVWLFMTLGLKPTY